MIDFIITFGDALSQLLGRCIPVRYDGKWHHYTRTANESISGASNWHSDNGRWPWLEEVINFVFFPFEDNHCLRARINDRSRAGQLLASEPPETELPE